MERKTKKPSKIAALRAWVNRHRLATMIIGGLFAIAVVGNVALALLGQPLPKLIPDIIVHKPKPKVYYSPLTGLKVKNQAATTKPVTAIMIENNLDGRPQSGLKQAEVVYEAIAEGDITRFMAFYQQNKPQLIGPVRSIRPYDIDWAQSWQASLVHVGGSAKALAQLRKGGYRNLDQFFNAAYYWRTADRYPPDNMYTSFKKLDALNKAKGYKTSHPKGMLREDTKASKKPTARKISVHISTALYNSTYRYDAKHNYYVRSMGGSLHKDREKGTITPKVVIAMTVNEKTQHQSDTYRQVIQTTGSGKAVVFQNGDATKVTWHRKSNSSAFEFTTADGKPFALARGQTWITALPKGKGSVTWHK